MILQKESQIVQQSNELSDFEQVALDKDRQVKELTMLVEDLESIQKHNLELREQADEARSYRIEMEAERQAQAKRQQDQLEQEYAEREALIGDKQEMQQQIIDLQAIINKMHLASDQASLTLAKKDHQIDQQLNQLLLLEEIQTHRDEMEQQLLQGQQSRVELSE